MKVVKRKNVDTVRERERERELHFNKIKSEIGITLVALIVTIIILLILAGISIASLTENGLFEKAKLAKEKQENAQAKEDETLGDYENNINDYVYGYRDIITEEKIKEYIKNEVTSQLGNNRTTLWTGLKTSGEIELSDSIYNYDYLIIISDIGGMSAVVNVDASMSKIIGGSRFCLYYI